MKRGEVYWAELVPRPGSGQTGRRPVVVVSHDGFNQAAGWMLVIVAPLSPSPSQARRGPTVVGVRAGVAGLGRESVVVCHQVTTLDRAKLKGRIGVLPEGVLEGVEEGLRAALDLG